MVRRNLGLPHRLISKNFNCVIWDKAIRLLGLSLSNLNTEEKKQISVQLKIPFEEFEKE